MKMICVESKVRTFVPGKVYAYSGGSVVDDNNQMYSCSGLELNVDGNPAFRTVGKANDPLVKFAIIPDSVTEGQKAEKSKSGISKTGLMCTACYSNADYDAVFCKYCGAKFTN